MQYKIESIGSSFRNKDIANLAQHLTTRASEGWKFHSVFQIQQPGCFGIGTPAVTYLAVYVKD